MSWARLCSLLGELGYEGHGALDPDKFHWPFQYEDARPILDWLCSSLCPSNVLFASELFQLTSDDHKCICNSDMAFHNTFAFYRGKDLDFTCESISAFSTRRDNKEAVLGAEEGLK
ncbi:hypothetical protein LXL04_035601 [Taraxacum kok-saghyz]